MSRIGLVLALASIPSLLPSIASAQAPGEAVYGPELPPAEAAPEAMPAADAPAAALEAPPPRGPFATVVVAAPPRPVELQKRIGVSARMVSLGLTDGTTTNEYAGGGIAASYRLTRRWELVLALDALDAPEGPDLHSTSLEARFHLTPYRRWDWYGVVGIGALHETQLDDGEHAHDDGPARGRMHVGVGLQRRFRWWSLGAELHSVAVGPKDPVDTMATARTTTPTTATDEGLTGGELTLAATLFF